MGLVLPDEQNLAEVGGGRWARGGAARDEADDEADLQLPCLAALDGVELLRKCVRGVCRVRRTVSMGSWISTRTFSPGTRGPVPAVGRLMKSCAWAAAKRGARRGRNFIVCLFFSGRNTARKHLVYIPVGVPLVSYNIPAF